MSTYTPIASQTLGSAAASVTFSSIPQGYTDLVIVSDAILVSGTGAGRIRYNSDSGSNYSNTYVYGDGSTAASGRSTSQTSIDYNFIGTSRSASVCHIQNYSNTTTNKTLISRGNGGGVTIAYVGLWRNTAAITSVEIIGASNFNTGSTFSIYGIQVGQASQKAQGGNIVTTDGTYVYHTFTSSGSFIPSQALTVDYLVVAGGGGGGGLQGGGGGAGGYRTSIGGSTLSLTPKTYPVTVGAGGAGSAAALGVKGSDSIFSSITSTGGGYGSIDASGGTGGSGGGAGGAQTGGAGNTPSTSPSQGNNGGNGNGSGGIYGAGGGGGASAVGGTGTTSVAGNGGNGTVNSISGTSVTYAGGGAGGAYQASTFATGGTGGGGNAGANGGNNPGNPGTVNTGGGGGGGHYQSGPAAGGAGGSGIVIIRYLA